GTGTQSAGSVSDEVQAPAAPLENYVPPDPTNLANTTGSYWVNYTWSSGASNASDSYNVSLNGTWTNGTTDTFMNTSVGASGWANITVFAYNASGTGTQSAGSVSDEVQAPAAPLENYVPPDPTNLANTTGSYWVNYTWSAGTGNASDSYNVSLNGTWTNGTANTFMNTSVGPSGWANITVFAYNASGTGTLSAGSVSDEVRAPAAPEQNYIPPDPTNLANTTGSYWVNYTWSSGASNASDSYNVSLNGTWTNGTTDTFMNTSVGASGWANITVFAYNTSGTGTQSAGSVSDEVQAPAAPPENYVPADPTNLLNTTGSYWVNYTWSAGTGNASDSYNVSLNGTWTNGTANTFMNTSVGPSGWANITVFAYNASGTGTLSAGSVSDEVQAPAAPLENYVPPDPTNLANTTGSYWVNYTWSSGASNVTDSYNVSLNGTWTNGTASTFVNTSVGPSGWANITVFAYNAS
ncbi:MAG: hypothetical protein K8R19_00520, partial [Methanosarcinales archaeon]|nr:hypothetical protein [Methanosarcinales archaeon]